MMIVKIAACFLAVCFLCFLTYAPKKSIVISGLIGALGYFVYMYFFDAHKLLQFFSSAFAMSVMGEIAARLFKMPSTIFITNAILPIIPGSGLYYTVRAMVLADYPAALEHGSGAMLAIAAIALAIAISSMIFSFFIPVIAKRKPPVTKT